MFEFCSDPDSISGLRWMACYLTTPKHASFYISFFTVFALIAIAAPCALGLGLAAALGQRSPFSIVRWVSWAYTSVVRGVPDIVFFLFVPIALDQGIEWLRHKVICWDSTEPIRRGNDFVVCGQAKMPLNEAAAWVHDIYGFFLAVIAFALVMGAFCSNVLSGALKSVAVGQIEAGKSLGLSRRHITWRIEIPQMWIYALPGLSNLWQLLIKATPLLFLLGVEDIVYWARELGGRKGEIFEYPHGDWRLWYFLALMCFYLLFTWASQRYFEKLQQRLSRGQSFAKGGA